MSNKEKYEFCLETIRPYGDIERKRIVASEPNLVVPIRYKRSRTVFYGETVPEEFFSPSLEVKELRAGPDREKSRVDSGDTTYILHYLGPVQ